MISCIGETSHTVYVLSIDLHGNELKSKRHDDAILIMKANEMHYFSASVILTTLADANRTSMTNTYYVYKVLRYS